MCTLVYFPSYRGSNWEVIRILTHSSDALAPSSFLLLVVLPPTPSSVLAPSSDALAPSSFLLLV